MGSFYYMQMMVSEIHNFKADPSSRQKDSKNQRFSTWKFIFENQKRHTRIKYYEYLLNICKISYEFIIVTCENSRRLAT